MVGFEWGFSWRQADLLWFGSSISKVSLWSTLSTVLLLGGFICTPRADIAVENRLIRCSTRGRIFTSIFTVCDQYLGSRSDFVTRMLLLLQIMILTLTIIICRLLLISCSLNIILSPPVEYGIVLIMSFSLWLCLRSWCIWQMKTFQLQAPPT